MISISSSTAEVKMLIIATAALLVLAANAEAAAIQYNPESRDTHVSDEPSQQHKRGFYYTDLHGKKINDVASWAPSWSSFRDAHPAEPSYSREPMKSKPYKESKPAYKEYNAPQAATKDNGQYGTNMKKHTTPKTAKISKPTTYTRQEPAVRYARSSPTFAQSYRLRRKRSSGDGDETLKRLADALALVTHSLLSGEHLHHPMSAEKPVQEQEEPEAVVEDEPEEQPDDEKVDPKNEELDSDDGEVDSDDDEVDPKNDEVDPDKKHHDEDDEEEEEEFKDEVDPDDEEDEVDPKDDEDSDAHDEEDSDDEVDPKDDDEDEDEEDHDDDDEVDIKDDDEEDTEDPEEDTKKLKKKSRKSKKKSKKSKKKSKKFNEESEDSDMDDMDSDMDYYGDGYSDYAPGRFRSPAYRRYKKRSTGMDYDGYPDYTRKPPSRPSYMHPAYRYKVRGKRSAGLSRSQLKKYRMSQEARFRRMQSAAGQKRRRKNKHMRAKKYYYM